MAPRARFELATLRLTAKVVEILNALSCVAYRETQPVFSPSVGLLGLLGLCIDLIARCGSYPDCSEEPKEKVAEVRRWEGIVAVREGTGKTEAAKLRGGGIGPKQRPQENARQKKGG